MFLFMFSQTAVMSNISHCLQGIWMFSLVQYQPFSMAGYEYPTWALVLGWLLAAMSIVCIPVGMVHAVYTSKGATVWEVGNC